MIHYAFIAATWLVGVAGVSGAVLIIVGLILFGPTAVQAILAPILRAFLTCRPCEIALAVVLTLLAAYWIGRHDASAECKADALAQELAIKNADLANAKQAKDDATNRANTIEAIADAHAKKDAAYIAALKNRPACALDSSDVGGMREHGFRFTLPSLPTK